MPPVMILMHLALQVVAEDATAPRVAIAPDGAVHVVFVRRGDVELVSSADGGKTWTEPRKVLAGGRVAGAMDRGPRIGVDAKGTILVSSPACFDAQELKKPYPAADLWLARSSDWSKRLRVNEVPRKAAEALHDLAVEPDGTAHVAWLDSRELGANCVWYAQVGARVGRNVRLTGPVCECCAPGIAVDAEGRALVAFRESGKDRGIAIVRPGGRPLRASAPSSGVQACPMDGPAVAVSADGKRIDLAWMDMRNGGRETWERILESGKPMRETQVAGPESGQVSLALADDGAVWAAWQSGESVFVRSSEGKTERIADGSAPALAVRNGVRVLVHEQRSGRSPSVAVRFIP